jgi:hypothetical protein
MKLNTRIFLNLCIVSLAAVLSFTSVDSKAREDSTSAHVDLIMKSSNENFKSIKQLHAAIINYGGGSAEFDSLVSEYSDASTLYFKEQFPDSEQVFARNVKSINSAAYRLAQIYKKDTESIHGEVIRERDALRLQLSHQGGKVNASAELMIDYASSGLNKANDELERFRPIDAIYYFRRAKESCFRFYEILGMPLPDKYRKDAADNKNQVFMEMEK